MRKADWPQHAAFVRRLNALKKREGIDLDVQLAEMSIGVSHTAISNWRHGKVKPSYAKLAVVAAALNEPPSDLAKVAGLIEGQHVAEREALPDQLEHLAGLHRRADEPGRIALARQLTVVIDWFEATQMRRR